MDKNKYGNRQTVVDGKVFDSKKEARRWQELYLMALDGEIANLKCQVKYDLIPAQYVKGPGGKKILAEKGVAYIADFDYDEVSEYFSRDIHETKKYYTHVVEDVKGHRTKEYIIKRKLMLWVHGIRIREV